MVVESPGYICPVTVTTLLALSIVADGPRSRGRLMVPSAARTESGRRTVVTDARSDGYPMSGRTVVVAREPSRCAAAERDLEHPFVEEQLVDAGGVAKVEVVPAPPEPVPCIGERIAAALQPPRHVADVVRAQRVGNGAQCLHDVTPHVIAHGRVAATDHDQIAAQHTAFHGTPRGERRAELILGAEQRERDGAGDDLLVRRRHEQLAGVARVERVAALGVDDENAPVRVAELRLRHHRVDGMPQLAARARIAAGPSHARRRAAGDRENA